LGSILRAERGRYVPRIALYGALAALVGIALAVRARYGGAEVRPDLPASKTRIEAVAQSDPDDVEEQGADIAFLRDEKAANPQNIATAVALGRRLMQAGRHCEAEQELHQALRRDPAHPGARHLLGSALAAQGQTERAIREWEKLVQTGDPTWSSIAQGAIDRVRRPRAAEVMLVDTPATPAPGFHRARKKESAPPGLN
jgi:cytochrome c-type biogenesis protein CcmH/NrfG